MFLSALPLSMGSMAVTGGAHLSSLNQGVWSVSKKIGPFPKLAAAGILGCYAVGKASYVPTCRNRFQRLGLVFGPESEYGFGPGPFGGRGFGGRGSGPGPRHCHHVCEECKRQQAPATPTEAVQS
ncbi:OCIA domain-containing protein 2 [Coregonus clupeaformis]|uniref:OCIA domain-containing protein 2 n=1 Tax=Coregonus clupeaformis TaxID=59861 RepID=UPI001BE125BB|nr:OCIA domain-containing protein 2 [Coregonus clupeaformis]